MPEFGQMTAVHGGFPASWGGLWWRVVEIGEILEKRVMRETNVCVCVCNRILLEVLLPTYVVVEF